MVHGFRAFLIGPDPRDLTNSWGDGGRETKPAQATVLIPENDQALGES